ncbi:amino acid/amide ABC transporter membrane protein 2, HAAT family [Halobiforma haloterrestris]|uniref:Amino acid/amide ABC transporter membrane protein 2, HAAT family n=1 Tax=Natronobacterium haloterrestre TaxID=148448 RepID=A0A1I1DAU0_NATHA|nr:branched-chain amino acid ABC transporter permease [Halobiforma haloterrestris]SFB71924.1 amino acid/amide ABC transporter membrane protein 2, HAAT family [Halobiforma haloterrestris]
MSRFLVERDGRTHLRLMEGMELSRNEALLAVVGIGFLLAVPDIARVTPLSFAVFHQGILFGIAALGLNLLLRHTELVSFGHAAFFGAGAYTAAVLASHYDVSSGLVLLAASIAVATLLALLVGYFVAGYLDIYFALLTLAFNQVLFAFVIQSQFFNYSDGLRVRPDGLNPPALFGLDLGTTAYEIVLYYFTILLLVVMLLGTWKLVNSPFGRALDAIGQDRTRARFVGIPVEKYVWIAFTLSGIYGGLAGGLFGMVQLHVRPEPVLYAFVSGEILFMAILGGVNTLAGPIVGGIVLVYLLNIARFYVEYYHALTGIVLLAVVFFLPQGILGSLPMIGSGLERRRDDPGLFLEDVKLVLGSLRKGVTRAITTVRIIIFGVN